MEENFRKIIEIIKQTNMNPDETKKYILLIKNVLGKALENCKDEQEESEILSEYLEEYKKDLGFRGDAQSIFGKMLKYSSYKKVLGNYKGNKSTFDSTMREAKRRENANRLENLTIKLDSIESMISAVRYAIRKSNTTSERWIIECIQEEKGKTSRELKNEMIKIIQHSVAELEEYGIIDEYIESSNSELEKLDLSGLKYSKRNPVADEQYNENGQLVENVEDIGVIDTFSTDNLKNMSVEDLEIMAAFWESKYLQERLELSKAMSVIRTLDLWDIILHSDDEEIQKLDNDKIINALKKDLALTYLCKQEVEITPRIKRQYKKFLKQNNMNQDVQLEDEAKDILPEISNLNATAKDIGILEGLIVYQLKTKDIKIKKWGTIDEEENDSNGIVLAIENPNFRGPLVMEVPENILREFLEEKNRQFPKYEKKLNEEYCEIMSKLYLPANKFFATYVKNEFEKNPQSEFLADLAGKKVKEER